MQEDGGEGARGACDIYLRIEDASSFVTGQAVTLPAGSQREDEGADKLWICERLMDA